MKRAGQMALIADWQLAGIIDAPTAQALQAKDPGRWWLNLLLGLAAWFSALLMISATMGPWVLLVDNALGRSLYALILLWAAWQLQRNQGLFVEQLALALSLSGQGVLVFVWSSELRPLLDWSQSIAVVGLPLALAMFWLLDSQRHRQLCVLFALLYASMLLESGPLLLVYAGLLAGVAVLGWSTRRRWAKLAAARYFRPALDGVTLFALLLALSAQQGIWLSLPQQEADILWFQGYRLSIAMLTVLAVIWLFRIELAHWRWAAPLIALVLVLLLFQAPALLLASTLGLLVFHARSWLWSLLSPLVVLVALAEWYYNLQLSLLHKSWLLMLAGMLLLACYWLWQRRGRAAV
ncbi:MAG: DUF4401 domain-containing protein [Pseudomonadaceae bacterium]|nr:MAG: DUF4401 domain-containing protein [Pseudomonadaceae bacterium]